MRTRLRLGRGAPRHPIAARSGVGLFGPDALSWRARAGEWTRTITPALLAGTGASGRPSAHEAVCADDDETVGGADVIGHRIGPGEVFRYAVLPELRADLRGDARFAAQAVALDLRFDDGSLLSELTADAHGIALDPTRQRAGAFLLPDQWTRVEVPLTHCHGRRVLEVVLRTAADVPGTSTGFVDAIEIARPRPLGDRPTDAVRTRRGTHSAMLYSRGLTVPAVSVPHALIMATPVTDATSAHWVYAWHEHNGPDGRPGVEAFGTTLIPSPWIGERAAFHVMPSALPVPAVDPDERRLGFDHRHEYDRVHHYRVRLDGGIVGEIAPARAAVAMRFTIPGGGSLLFDRLGVGRIEISLRAGGAAVTGYVDQTLERVPNVPRMFVFGEVDGPVTAVGHLPTGVRGADRGDAAWLRVEGVSGDAAADAGEGATATVTVRLGVSFISVDQARRNLAADIGGASFDEVASRARQEWDDALSAIEVTGATREQRITLASGLVRVLMFPNTAHELVDGEPVYASPFHAPEGATPEHTGLRLRSGPLSTNNGYWDTYRTAWPLLGLIDPRTPELLDGVVQHARDSGWTTRWSAPGHVDVMVGTSSDAIFADLALKGIEVDHAAAFAAGVRNASVVPPAPEVGRKGQARALFRSYTSTEVWEGMSWTLEAAINDHALARYAAWLADRADAAGDAGEHERLRALEEWLRGRAAVYASVFNRANGFFQGRDPDGSWRVRSDDFDPGVWGTDYVETNGWGMAFTVPHDGAGLAALHGGEERLAERLEEFFATSEPGDVTVRGSYSYQIHEISEARDQRLGQLALSNQPAHHIPAMWTFAGRPDRAHEVTREAVERLFAGPELGGGNPGDEDNGEMSAWWILNAVGLYPLIPGEPGWVIMPPLFETVRLRLASGGVFTVTTQGRGRFIVSATLDGEPWESVWLPHERVAPGAVLHLELSDRPRGWGADSRPPSASAGLPRMPVDRALRVRTMGEVPVEVAQWSDDDAETGARVPAGAVLEVDVAPSGAARPSLVTFTVAGPATVALVLSAPNGTLRWDADVDAEVRTMPVRISALALDGGDVLRVENVGGDLDLREIEILSYEEWDPARDAGWDR